MKTTTRSKAVSHDDARWSTVLLISLFGALILMFANSNADVEQAGSIQAPAKAEVEITAPTDIATAAATPQTMADAG